METIFIPKMSVLTRNKHVFTSLDKFSSITGYIPTPFAEIDSDIQGSRFSRLLNMFRGLKQKNDDPLNNFEDEEKMKKLFTAELKKEVRERKRFLLLAIKRHEVAMAELMKAKLKCLKSKTEIEHMNTTIDNQKSSVQYKQHEKTARTVFKARQALLNKWKWDNTEDRSVFEEKLEEEIQCREEIQKIAKEIEEDITDLLYDNIRVLMEKHNEYISDNEITKLSQQIYSQTCRSYKFTIIKNDPNSKEFILEPTYEKSKLNKRDMIAKNKLSSKVSTQCMKKMKTSGKRSQQA